MHPCLPRQPLSHEPAPQQPPLEPGRPRPRPSARLRHRPSRLPRQTLQPASETKKRRTASGYIWMIRIDLYMVYIPYRGARFRTVVLNCAIFVTLPIAGTYSLRLCITRLGLQTGKLTITATACVIGGYYDLVSNYKQGNVRHGRSMIPPVRLSPHASRRWLITPQ